MGLHIVEGTDTSVDKQMDRTQAGTIGTAHVAGLGSSSSQSVVDDADPRIVYGGGTGRTISEANPLSYGTTSTTLNPGEFAQLFFSGTTIAVLGTTNPDGSIMDVFIDGVRTPGAIASTATLALEVPALQPTDTTVFLSNGGAGFPAPGTVLIDAELISYTTITPGVGTASTLTGLTRGAFGTVATTHEYSSTVYDWSDNIDTFTTAGPNFRQILWYNNNLPNGTHTITVLNAGAGLGGSNLYFDGFVAGSLLGASNIFTQTQVLKLSFSTDGNGHAEIGKVSLIRTDVAMISILGYTQTNCEATSTNVMGKLGLRYDSNLNPYLYYHNGPTSTALTVNVTLGFIGESI